MSGGIIKIGEFKLNFTAEVEQEFVRSNEDWLHELINREYSFCRSWRQATQAVVDNINTELGISICTSSLRFLEHENVRAS